MQEEEEVLLRLRRYAGRAAGAPPRLPRALSNTRTPTLAPTLNTQLLPPCRPEPPRSQQLFICFSSTTHHKYLPGLNTQTHSQLIPPEHAAIQNHLFLLVLAQIQPNKLHPATCLIN